MAICEFVSAYRDCIIRQRLAVIGLRCACRGQRHGPLVDRQRTRLVLDLVAGSHILACGVDDLRIAGFQFAGVGSCIRSSSCDGHCLNPIACGQIRCYSVPILSVRLAVIRDGIVFGGDRYLFPSHTTVGHCQSAELGSDVVVLSLGTRIQRVGERVIAAANHCLAAGEGVGCAFAFCPTGFRLKSGSAVDQRRAVIRLAQIGRLQRHIALGDRQRTVHRGILIGRAFRAGDGNIADDVISSAGIGLAAGDGSGNGNRIAANRVLTVRIRRYLPSAIGHGKAIGGQRRAVIGLRGTVGRQRDLVVQRPLPLAVQLGITLNDKGVSNLILEGLIRAPTGEGILVAAYGPGVALLIGGIHRDGVVRRILIRIRRQGHTSRRVEPAISHLIVSLQPQVEVDRHGLCLRSSRDIRDLTVIRFRGRVIDHIGSDQLIGQIILEVDGLDALRQVGIASRQRLIWIRVVFAGNQIDVELVEVYAINAFSRTIVLRVIFRIITPVGNVGRRCALRGDAEHIVSHQLMAGRSALRPIELVVCACVLAYHMVIVAVVPRLKLIHVPCLIAVGHTFVIVRTLIQRKLTAVGLAAVDNTGLPEVIVLAAVRCGLRHKGAGKRAILQVVGIQRPIGSASSILELHIGAEVLDTDGENRFRHDLHIVGHMAHLNRGVAYLQSLEGDIGIGAVVQIHCAAERVGISIAEDSPPSTSRSIERTAVGIQPCGSALLLRRCPAAIVILEIPASVLEILTVPSPLCGAAGVGHKLPVGIQIPVTGLDVVAAVFLYLGHSSFALILAGNRNLNHVRIMASICSGIRNALDGFDFLIAHSKLDLHRFGGCVCGSHFHGDLVQRSFRSSGRRRDFHGQDAGSGADRCNRHGASVTGNAGLDKVAAGRCVGYCSSPGEGESRILIQIY